MQEKKQGETKIKQNYLKTYLESIMEIIGITRLYIYIHILNLINFFIFKIKKNKYKYIIIKEDKPSFLIPTQIYCLIMVIYFL